jgi:hypothetical protein
MMTRPMAASADPGEGPFHHLALQVHGKAALVARIADNDYGW